MAETYVDLGSDGSTVTNTISIGRSGPMPPTTTEGVPIVLWLSRRHRPMTTPRYLCMLEMCGVATCSAG